MLWGYSPLMAVKRCGWMWYLALEAFKCQIPGMRLAGVVHPAQPQCLVTVLSRMQAWEYFNCLFLSNKVNHDVLVPSFKM